MKTLFTVTAVALATALNTSAQNVDALVGRMTLPEKIDYIGGTGFGIRAVPRLQIPAFNMSDGPLGVRSNEGFPSTVYAAGIGLAATWNRALAEEVGAGIGRDARARGIHFMLGPGMNIYRSPRNGRNFEYFGEDPFLAAAVATGYIRGMQAQGVSATAKHYLANNSEFLRHDSDSIVDERALREIYLPAFEAAVKQAHVGAVMDSYNLIDGAHATQSGRFNVEVLRKEWGFDGVLMSDWGATYDGLAAARNGLDLEMPNAAFMNQKNLLPAVQDGRLPVAVIDEKVRHILATAERFGWLSRPQEDVSLSTYNNENHAIALQSARESIVLLKNEGAVLPLDRAKVKSVLVVGPDAYPAQPVGGGSGAAIPFSAVSILEGIAAAAPRTTTVYYERGLPSVSELINATAWSVDPDGKTAGVKVETFGNRTLSGAPKSVTTVKHIDVTGLIWEDLDDSDPHAYDPKNLSHRWSAYYRAPEAGRYELLVEYSGEGDGMRVRVDDKLVIDQWAYAKAVQDHVALELAAGPHHVVIEHHQDGPVGGRMRVALAGLSQIVAPRAIELARKADVVVIAAGFDRASEAEGADRTYALPVGQDALIRALAAANPRTIVTVTAGGSVDTSRWIERVPAFLQLWYPGEKGGTALAEILFGDVDPSGRLPITYEKRIEDDPSYASYYPVPGTKRVEYREGIFAGYRGFEHAHTVPLYPFGAGLSYTTFKYANLTIAANGAGADYAVSFDVTNTGPRAGAEVAQVYVGEPGAAVPRPPKELKGFEKVSLRPGETKRVTIPLTVRSFAYFDPTKEQWHADAGAFSVLVGHSSAEIELTGTITLPRVFTEAP